MPLTSVVAAARENALPFQVVLERVVVACVGREECFFWKNTLPKCRYLSSTKFLLLG